ncbi:MAG: helix-hairpin-helix domain-containing protein [Fluviicoccus sp.]|uniref:ComEA family DNA-binding protein n=1 Tax=Fluviicoccus sp. TaxID=2003552 RepID=UPI0027225FB0|nr:helix-hairpin-helix domain-containing protein [Fluviicoccus sp.]MDO8332127.1 helix-hairpin-helix domain-containing protein [Fluviicoccus sp.]
MTITPFAVCFAGQQSYALQDDQVYLQAELSLPTSGACSPLALQLWAKREDDAAITIKLAELPVLASSPDGSGLMTVQGYAPLSLPAGGFSYVLSLLVVEMGGPGLIEHDQILFPSPTVFDLPQLTGTVSAELLDGEIRLTVPGVFNPRPDGSLSGSLSVALWALPQPYQGGAFTGVLLGHHDLGQLAGQAALAEQVVTLPLALELEGEWELTAMLREWTGGGLLTRDYQTLPVVMPVAATAESETALPVKAEAEVAAVNVSTTAPEQAEADVPVKKARVSINTASLEALATVKGVGAKLAAAIVAGRPYAALTDLLKVKGMGAKLLAKLEKLLGL